jgi:hypothetical protein
MDAGGLEEILITQGGMGDRDKYRARHSKFDVRRASEQRS